ncbi:MULTISPECIES: hypothetical protein [unclassified Streptomyces]|uniref:hypothetical protein n=1 Tax=unclassified Streptomyces TaxID=2593676 RepID=UPI002DDB0285|nr:MULTISPECIES: hypothetical protein [unclassified Streptomyces]WSA93941.1 hypothetical protein OIE63_21915 [Streptomyces sp. NBC_01795]WSB78367.1 hypothetical protein OHB04_23045 [Streptomyces sp. NBC_01775]WSS13430.1 hypothetical protein OG533_17195 [Streptomyces sp. NBC_01186]WSS42219.1 hypothetical protein OG220_17755 [Streptomyces sp. NBC_01187]
MLDIGYALSRRFPDPPQTDYRTADVRALRHDLFCGDVYLADTAADRELSTAWGWVPVLDFAWALCGIAEELDRDPLGARSAGPHRAELDFTESTERLRFTRRFGWVEITADWTAREPAGGDATPLSFSHKELRREARDFLHDLLADLTDMHEGLDTNPAVWDLAARFPRV